jgi:hypothetical protein
MRVEPACLCHLRISPEGEEMAEDLLVDDQPGDGADQEGHADEAR